MKSVAGTVVAMMAAVVFTAGTRAQVNVPETAAGGARPVQTAVTEQADGTVVVTLDERQVIVPASVVADVTSAVRDHADDPDALRLAIRMIVAEHAGSPDTANLASAIAVVAIFRAGVGSASADAIMRGATFGNPGVSAAAVLSVLPEIRPIEAGTPEAAQTQLAQLQATVENPSQVSPVQ